MNDVPLFRIQTLRWVARGGIGLGILGLVFRKLTDFDLPWHIAFGQLVARLKTVPRIDDFSYTHPPIGYTDFLSDLALFTAYRSGGPLGVQILGALVCGAWVATLLWRSRGTDGIKYFTTFLAIAGASRWLFVRPTILALVFLSLALGLLELYDENPSRKNERLLACFIPLQIVWSNFHQSASLGVLLLTTYVVSQAIVGFVPTVLQLLIAPRPPKRLPVLMAIAVLSILGTTFNRAGLRFFANPVNVATSMGSFVTEWALATPSFYIVTEPLVGLFLAFSAAGLVLGRDAHGKWRRPSVLEWIFYGASVGMLRYLRMSPLVITLLAPLLARQLHGWGCRFRIVDVLGHLAPLFVAPILALRFVDETGVGFYDKHFPEGAVRFIESANPKGPMWNFSPYGGYLTLRLYPEHRTFTDGRVLHGLEFAANAARAERDPGMFQRLLQRYDFQWAVCRATEGESFCEPIANTEAWTMVYWDDISAVYVRNGGTNEALRPKGYEAIHHLWTPQMMLEAALQGDRRLHQDAQLAIAQAPQHARAWFLSACAAIANKEADEFQRAVAAVATLSPNPNLALVLKDAFKERLANTRPSETRPDPGPSPSEE